MHVLCELRIIYYEFESVVSILGVLVCSAMSSISHAHTQTQTVSACFVSMALTIYSFLNQFLILLCIHVYAKTYREVHTHTRSLAHTQKETDNRYRVARCCNVDAIARSVRIIAQYSLLLTCRFTLHYTTQRCHKNKSTYACAFWLLVLPSSYS